MLINLFKTTIDDVDLEQCRSIITQNNDYYIRALLQFLTIYYDIRVQYTYTMSNKADTQILLPYNGSNPYQSIISIEVLDPTINIVYKNNTLELILDGKHYGPMPVQTYSNGVRPINGWPKELNMEGVVQPKNGTLTAKVKYPVHKVAELLKNNNNVFLALEKCDMIDLFLAADTDLEKIVITTKAILDYLSKKLTNL